MNRTQAEQAGWVFVHAQAEAIEDKGDGVLKKIAGNHRAEKSVAGRIVNQSSGTEEGLLAAIASWEDDQARRAPAAAVPVSTVEVESKPKRDAASVRTKKPGKPKPKRKQGSVTGKGHVRA